MAITIMFSILEGMKADMIRNEQSYNTGEIRVRHRDFDRYEHQQPVHFVVEEYAALLNELRKTPELGPVSPRISVPAVAFRDERRIVARGLGLDMRSEGEFMDLEAVVAAGGLPEPGSTQALIGVGLAERLIRSRTGQSRELTDSVNAVLDRSGRSELAAVHWSEASEGYAYMQFADIAYNFMALFFFILGATVVINTTMMTVYERTREIGTLVAMGMRSSEIVRLFFTESAYLGLAGSIVGVFIGISIVIPLQSVGIDFGSTTELMDGFTISPVLYPALNARSTAGTFVFSFAVAAVAGFIPARRAARLKPVDALRE